MYLAVTNIKHTFLTQRMIKAPPPNEEADSKSNLSIKENHREINKTIGVFCPYKINEVRTAFVIVSYNVFFY